MSEIAFLLFGILLGGGAIFLFKKKIFAGEYKKVQVYKNQLEARNLEELERAKKQSLLELK
ncbi:MAG: hypothetical protein IH584_03495, partial [Candidatus Aminicenantes bacterium]|nr:hypothetical protein [Candidatus Aminicenantes bacterium]